eukprot:COSAG04_NODE_2143_length_4696_cov_2.321242_2_plen_364_part_00
MWKLVVDRCAPDSRPDDQVDTAARLLRNLRTSYRVVKRDVLIRREEQQRADPDKVVNARVRGRRKRIVHRDIAEVVGGVLLPLLAVDPNLLRPRSEAEPVESLGLCEHWIPAHRSRIPHASGVGLGTEGVVRRRADGAAAVELDAVALAGERRADGHAAAARVAQQEDAAGGAWAGRAGVRAAKPADCSHGVLDRRGELGLRCLRAPTRSLLRKIAQLQAERSLSPDGSRWRARACPWPGRSGLWQGGRQGLARRTTCSARRARRRSATVSKAKHRLVLGRMSWTDQVAVRTRLLMSQPSGTTHSAVPRCSPTLPSQPSTSPPTQLGNPVSSTGTALKLTPLGMVLSSCSSPPSSCRPQTTVG